MPKRCFFFLFTFLLTGLCLFAQKFGQTFLSTSDLKGTTFGYGAKTFPAKAEIAVEGGEKLLRLFGDSDPLIKGRSQYYSIKYKLKQNTNLEHACIVFQARTNCPDDTAGFYIRLYNENSKKPVMSFSSWDCLLQENWTTFYLEKGVSYAGLNWEDSVVEKTKADKIRMVEFIIGTRNAGKPVELRLKDLQYGNPLRSVHHLKDYPAHNPKTPLVIDGQSSCIILHPNTEAGRVAASQIASAIQQKTGVLPQFRPGTLDDCKPARHAIIIGNLDSNPALRLLYARGFTLADAVFPGTDGYMIHTVPAPFGSVNAVVVAVADQNGLDKATKALCREIHNLNGYTLPPLHMLSLNPKLQEQYKRFLNPLADNYVERGLQTGQNILKNGTHCSIAGQLAGLGRDYLISNDSKIAKLYVELWKMYYDFSRNNQDTVLGKWGFDSDFVSRAVVSSWDVIEEEPELSDADRLIVLKCMHSWIQETVLPSCSGGNPGRVTHNHGTFPSLGALRYGEWLKDNFNNCTEAPIFVNRADAIFRAQALHAKPMEDCNTYQWLTLGHVLQYAMLKPDYSVFQSGVADKITDYCVNNMDNFSIQVPYGDTGSWRSGNAEVLCLDIIALATGSAKARWAANYKRQLKGLTPIAGMYTQLPRQGDRVPDNTTGVISWPLLLSFYNTFKTDGWMPPCNKGVDKITFREAMDPKALYILLDGITTGTHKHEDGNSISRLAQYNRIWLADNDYFKATLKYHNSIAILANGESDALPPFVELLACGENEQYGYSVTEFQNYVKTDWKRAVVWMKENNAVLVLDTLTAREEADFQFSMFWHGIGAPVLDDKGLLLTQQGVTMRIDIAKGPKLSLYNDKELGTNWAGYTYADPVVRSLSAVDNVHLKQGQSYTFATLFHGNPQGDTAPCTLSTLDRQNGVVMDDGMELAATLNGMIMDAKASQQKEGANFMQGREKYLVNIGSEGLLNIATRNTLTTIDASSCKVSKLNAKDKLIHLLPIRTIESDKDSLVQVATHEKLWETAIYSNRQNLSGNKALVSGKSPSSFSSLPAKLGKNILTGEKNDVTNLLDGSLINPGNSAMYPKDTTVVLTFTFDAPQKADSLSLSFWNASTSSKNTAYSLQSVLVESSEDGSFKDAKSIGTYTENRKLPDWGQTNLCEVPLEAVASKAIRITLTPKEGTALYLSELSLDGEISDEKTLKIPVKSLAIARLDNSGKRYLLAGTEQGNLIVMDKYGKIQKQCLFDSAINSIATADLNKDGVDEIVLALNGRYVAVLDANLKRLWRYNLDFYRRPPLANLVFTGDINGDGNLEVICGAENWRFYAFTAEGKKLWHYEVVHPARSGVVTDIDGDGKDDILCGTHYYSMSVLNGDGSCNWVAKFGPICWALAVGTFTKDNTKGIIAGSGNGYVYLLNSKGKKLKEVNTGEEVHCAMAVNLDAGTNDDDGLDEAIAASYSNFIYAWNADTSTRWVKNLGAPVQAIACASNPANRQTLLLAGLRNGRVVTLNCDGNGIRKTELGNPIRLMMNYDNSLIVTTEDGRILCVRP